jgi:hypothetical protein
MSNRHVRGSAVTVRVYRGLYRLNGATAIRNPNFNPVRRKVIVKIINNTIPWREEQMHQTQAQLMQSKKFS